MRMAAAAERAPGAAVERILEPQDVEPRRRVRQLVEREEARRRVERAARCVAAEAHGCCGASRVDLAVGHGQIVVWGEEEAAMTQRGQRFTAQI